MAKHVTGDVVVLLPGILGSVLARDGHEVWAPEAGAAWRAIRSLGRSVKELRLGADPIGVDDIDGVVATRLVPDVHLIPGLWSIDGYSGISAMIRDTFALRPGHFVEFPYDWRRDLRVAARQLHERLEPLLRAAPDAKVVLVAHSLGGLVARYYLECLEGWKRARMLVTFGTPYRGSLNALDFIANGFVKKVGPLTIAELSEFVRSCNSVYQLLPIYPCIDAGGTSGYVRAAESTGVPHLDASRATLALQAFHREIESCVGKRPPNAYEIHPVVGITQHTTQSVVLAGGKLELKQVRRRDDGEFDESGDGTVPRISATPIEVGEELAVFAPQKHASLQNVENVQIQLVGLMTRIPDLAGVKDLRDGVTLDIDDVFADNEPVKLEATPALADPGLQLEAEITNLGNGAGAIHVLTARGDGAFATELPPFPSGDYRVTVRGRDKSAHLVQPVSDVFMVAPEDFDRDE